MSRAESHQAERWESERRYFSGLGESADDASLLTVTPSGSTTRQGETPWYESLIKTAVPVLASAYQQNQMTKLNLARINQGQPPLTAEQYSAVYQPVGARVEVGASSGLMRGLMFAGLGIAAIVGLKAAKVI